MLRRGRSRSGYTLIEVQVTLLLIGIVSAISVFALQATIPALWADSAMDQTVAMMRFGRDAAITQRRRIQVQFTPPGRIDLIRLDGVQPIIATVNLESNPAFQLTAGLPDTPDGYGNANPVNFGGAAVVRFNPDGTLSDGAGVPLNGTIFIGSLNDQMLARAVTLTGVTGRAQGYRWDGQRWLEK